MVPFFLTRILLFVVCLGFFKDHPKKAGSDLLLKALSKGFNKIPVCLKDSVPLLLPQMCVFPFLTLSFGHLFFTFLSLISCLLFSVTLCYTSLR